jgi:hypothetical protein
LRGPTLRFSYSGAPVLAIGGDFGLCISELGDFEFRVRLGASITLTR